jgi:DNA-binding MarR family transcriptional regulator
MNPEVSELVATFRNILHVYSILEKQPLDLGVGIRVYLTEIQVVSAIGENPGINISNLADIMGVTRGAISQTVQKLAKKALITRSKERNKKEINLDLTPIGKIARDEFNHRMQEIFTFAEDLYNDASADDRLVAKQLFEAIYNNLRAKI